MEKNGQCFFCGCFVIMIKNDVYGYKSGLSGERYVRAEK